MEEDFYSLKNNKSMDQDDSTEKEVDLYKKIKEKKRKIKAHEILVKEFYSDDEEEENINGLKYKNYGIISKYKGQRDSIKTMKPSFVRKNSILIYKKHIQKKSTMDKINQNINKETSVNNTIKNKNSNKKVFFPDTNFVTYINVESYKKYNYDNCNKDFFSEYDENKAKSKCCNIY